MKRVTRAGRLPQTRLGVAEMSKKSASAEAAPVHRRREAPEEHLCTCGKLREVWPLVQADGHAAKVVAALIAADQRDAFGHEE